MNDITALAQRMKASALKAKSEANEWGYDTDAFHDEATPDAVIQVVEALEKAQDSGSIFQQSFFRQSLMYDVVAEAYEEAKEQIAKDVEIKARLCRESNSLFDRLHVAEKRIAELEKAASEPVAWTDEQELRDVERNGCGYLFTVNPITPHADPRRVIKLYTAPPALESRTVTVRLYGDFQLCHYGTTEDYAKGYIDCQNNFTKWLAAAGIQVIEGAQTE